MVLLTQSNQNVALHNIAKYMNSLLPASLCLHCKRSEVLESMALKPNTLLLAFKSISWIFSRSFCFLFWFLEAKFKLLPAMFAHAERIYDHACVRTRPIPTAFGCHVIFQNSEIIASVNFSVVHISRSSHARQAGDVCANQKVIIYVCWLTTTTKEINNHIEPAHWAQQVRMRAHPHLTKPETKRKCEKSVPYCVDDRFTIRAMQPFRFTVLFFFFVLTWPLLAAVPCEVNIAFRVHVQIWWRRMRKQNEKQPMRSQLYCVELHQRNNNIMFICQVHS